MLFVDEEESLARLRGRDAGIPGYVPVVRRDATEALEAFRLAPQRFDLLIADQAMSAMNGDLLARECQQLRPDLPVILCAGSEQTLSEDESRSLGQGRIRPEAAHAARSGPHDSTGLGRFTDGGCIACRTVETASRSDHVADRGIGRHRHSSVMMKLGFASSGEPVADKHARRQVRE